MEDGIRWGDNFGAVSSWWKILQGRCSCVLAWGPSTSFGWRLSSLRMTTLESYQLSAISYQPSTTFRLLK